MILTSLKELTNYSKVRILSLSQLLLDPSWTSNHLPVTKLNLSGCNREPGQVGAVNVAVGVVERKVRVVNSVKGIVV